MGGGSWWRLGKNRGIKVSTQEGTGGNGYLPTCPHLALLLHGLTDSQQAPGCGGNTIRVKGRLGQSYIQDEGETII